MWPQSNLLSIQVRTRWSRAGIVLSMLLNSCSRPAPSNVDWGAPATAINTITGKTFDPRRDGLPYTNFSDLMFSGYCLGITAVHAFSTLPPSIRLKSFGPIVETWFNDNPATNDNSAQRLIRFFSLLQITKHWMTYSNTLGTHKIRKLEEIKKTHELLQTEPHRSRGIIGFLQPIDTNQGFEISNGYHVVYIFGSRFQDGIYTFSYLDPNRPREPHSIRYDSATFTEEKKLEIEFNQSKEDPYSLVMYWTVDQMLKTAQASLAEIRQNVAFAPRLNFIEGDAFADFVAQRSWDQHDHAAKMWMGSLDLAAVVRNSPLGHGGQFAFKDYLAYEKFATIAQTQLENNCDEFRKFDLFLAQENPLLFDVLDAELHRIIREHSLTLDVEVTHYLVPQATQKSWRCLQLNFKHLFDPPKEEQRVALPAHRK